MEGKDSSRTEESSMHDERPHGYTLADEELERVHEKSMSGDVLDPIALDDPTGTSVERVVLRVGITVVAILVAGILLAQVACKNIRLSMVTDLGEGITQESVGSALSSGILWGGEIVVLPRRLRGELVRRGDGNARGHDGRTIPRAPSSSCSPPSRAGP